MRAHCFLPLVALALGCSVPSGDAEWVDGQMRQPPLSIISQPLPSGPQRSGPLLRVVTYNVEFGCHLDELAETFTRPPFDTADVFLLQEIDAIPSEGMPRAARLAEATGMAFVYVPAKIKKDGTHGMAILARREIADVRTMGLPYFPTSIRRDVRIAMAANVDGVDIVNVHLGLQLGLAERVVQLTPATQDLAPLAIVAGDMNTNPYGWADMVPAGPHEPLTDIDAAQVLDDAMVEFGFDAATRASGPTHSAPSGELRLDSIYPRGLKLEGAARVERGIELSDHWPLWIDVSIDD